MLNVFALIAKRKILIGAVFAANVLVLSVGVMEAWTSPILPKITNTQSTDNPLHHAINEEEESWIGALLSIGALIGPFPAAYLADRFGRKWALLSLGVPLIISFGILILAKDVTLYYVARTLSGISVGGVFAVLPTYVAEISEISIRGMLSTTINIFEVSGFLMSYAIGPYLSIKLFNIICMIIPCIFLLSFISMPETPYYLIARKKHKEAHDCLKKLRCANDGQVEKELEDITRCVENNLNVGVTGIFRTKGAIKALAISFALISFQQFSGVNVILYYSQTVFEATGSKIPAEICAIIIGSVQVGASFITPLIVERLGRRLLLLISAVGMLASEVPLGLYFYFKDNNTNVESLYWLPVTCLVCYIIVYNFGFGPLPWTVMSEIFPDNLKAVAASMTSCICWTLSFVITKYFHSVSVEIGMGETFWIFCGFNVLAAIFTYFCVPETQGKSFQDIQDELQL